MNKETQYHSETPQAVRNWLEILMNTDRRVRIFYGDTERSDFERVHGRKPEPGKDWGEDNDVIGTIGQSTGLKPIPLLIANKRSMGGGAVMDNCIVRLIVNGCEVYRHPNYHSSFDNAVVMESELKPKYSHAVVTNEGEVARFHSEKSAKNWLAFMRGERMAK